MTRRGNTAAFRPRLAPSGGFLLFGAEKRRPFTWNEVIGVIDVKENHNVWIWVLVAVALLFLFSSFGMGGYGMMGFGMGFGFLFMILFWGLVIWLVYSLINAAQSDTQRKGEDSMVILKKRYAKGEISKTQYEEMRKELIR